MLDQSVDRALASAIGPRGIPDDRFGALLEKSAGALERLRARHADGSLPLLQMPAETADLDAIAKAAERLSRDATDVVFLGTGGSSLGAQALCQLAGHAVPGLGLLRDAPRLHFLDNLDPVTLEALFERLPLATTRFLAVSKSGGTGETLSQTMAVLSALDAAGLDGDIGERIMGLSEPVGEGGSNALRELLAPVDARFLEHHTGIGGRFSVLTNVGLVPAAVAGLDVKAIREGAAAALKPILEGAGANEVAPAVGAALNVAAAEAGKPISVMMSYSDRLERTAAWWVQLWSESLGKDGKGTTPVRALGPVDQHSQLQLHLAGPADKLFTVVTLDVAGRGPRLDPKLAQRAGQTVFAGKTIGDLVAAQGRATAETLAKNGRPVRTIRIKTLDEHALGELLMHFMLETIIAADLMGVDAFDQPAVEEGKVLAKEYLARG